MRTFLFGTVAALGLAFGMAPQQASAHWETRTTSRYDPACCRNITTTQRYWVPDCVVTPPCVEVVTPRYCPPVHVRVHPEYRHYEHHEHHEFRR